MTSNRYKLDGTEVSPNGRIDVAGCRIRPPGGGLPVAAEDPPARQILRKRASAAE